MMAVYDRANAERHHADAVEFSRKALELAEQRLVATPDYVLSYGTDLVNVGRLDEGIERLRWYVGVEPNRFRGLVNLGGALTMTGHGAEALPLLERACGLEPGNPQAWVGLARAQHALGQRDAALASLRRAMALSPGDASIAQQLRSLEQGR
jgi:tetratricopeptide (TPR) repeat protein